MAAMLLLFRSSFFATMETWRQDFSTLLSLKNAWLPPIFFLDTKSTYEDLLSPDSFKPCKNIAVLVSIGDRKSEYLEMRRTYAH